MKKLSKLLITICAAFALAACDEAPKSDKPVVKIGATLPLTGNIAPLGNVIKEALLMAQAEIPANSKYKYEIIFEDDSYEIRKIVNNTHKFISVDKVDAVLTLFDGAVAATSPITEKAQIPNFGCTWGADFFKDYQYSFNHWSKPETQVRYFIDMLKDNKIDNFAIMMQNYALAHETMRYVEKYAADAKIKITSVSYFNMGTKDFKTDIEKIKKQKPAAVMLQMLDPELGIFVKQANEAGLKTRFVSIDQFLGAANKEALGNALFVLSSAGSDEFNKKLAKQTDLPNNSCAANLYDGFKLLVSIYESSDHKLTGEEVKDALYKVKDYPSALGMKISVDKDGIIDSPLFRARIENGKVIK